MREPLADLMGVLRAPDTGAELVMAHGRLQTEDGQQTFQVIGGLPVLLHADSVFSVEGYVADQPSKDVLSRRLRSLIRRIVPSLSHNLSATRNLLRLREALYEEVGRGARILVVGGSILGEGMKTLADDPDLRLVEVDVAVGPRTALICDAHALPFADDVFDAIVCQAVLEHVADPTRVVAEIHRVLKPSGLVYSEIPFMQQVHEGAYDFTRFTFNGHRRLFHYFDELDAGATAGPGMVMGWSARALLSAFAGDSAKARALVNVVTSLSLFWLKYLDKPFMGSAQISDGASGTYFLGRSRRTPRSDREIIAGYRGVNSGFSARR